MIQKYIPRGAISSDLITQVAFYPYLLLLPI